MKYLTFVGPLTLLSVLHSGLAQLPPKCAATSCAIAPCDRPDITPPGECCPICPPDCSAVSCLKPDCDVALITPPGQCCPVCPTPEDCTKVLCAKPACSNPTTPKGKCCPVCPICIAVLCPKPACDKPVLPPGECCAVCPKRAFCLHNGRTYPIGSRVPSTNPCRHCSCGTDGEIHCAIRRCPQRSCENPAIIKGHCCAICPTAGVCIAENGRKYRPGESVPNSNPCKHCTCLDSGEILCAIPGCLPPPCDNPVFIEGRCCPVCPPPGVCIAKDGTRYSVGDRVPSTNPCEICTCGLDGSINCAIRDCARAGCRNPVTQRGRCCPICPKTYVES